MNKVWELYPYGEGEAWQAPPDIANHTGVNVASLYIILKRWRENTWGYADGKYFNAQQMTDSRPHWLYKINAKGQAYLNRLPKWYEPLEAVLAEVVNYKEHHEDYCPHDLTPRRIAWHTKPSEWVTYIQWPSKSKGDAHYAMWYMGGYSVADMQEAIFTTKAVFGITPSQECLEVAKEIEGHFVKTALEKLATGAGLEVKTQ